MRAQGYTASFMAGAGTLRLLGGTREYRPEELTIRGYQQFEGVSDPDDMSIVFAIESKDGIRGTLLDAFGVYANPAVTAVMDHVTTCAGGR
ncbi:MAG: phosphoribosylpyrophosphate synthetase [Gaiellaceae bacterium]